MQTHRAFPRFNEMSTSAVQADNNYKQPLYEDWGSYIKTGGINGIT